jgi:hypothetical protein
MFTVSVVYDLNRTGGPESGLERRLIAEYLLSKGYRRSDLRSLPEEERKALMKEACIYAALRLANIEAKTKFSQKIKAP